VEQICRIGEWRRTSESLLPDKLVLGDTKVEGLKFFASVDTEGVGARGLEEGLGSVRVSS